MRDKKVIVSASVVAAALTGFLLNHAANQITEAVNNNVSSLKSKIPDDADIVIDRIIKNGSFTTNDKELFKAAVTKYATENKEAWKDIITLVQPTDGYYARNRYVPGLIDTFLKEVAEEIAKSKESAMLFKPDSFVSRVALAKTNDPGLTPHRQR